MENNQKELSEKCLDEIYIETILDNIDDDYEEIFFTFDDSEIENNCNQPLTYPQKYGIIAVTS